MIITPEVAEKINRLYLEIGTYSGVAKKIGCAASTVKKYVIKDFIPDEKKNIKKIDIKILPVNKDYFKDLKKLETCGLLTQEEKQNIEKLWEELSL